MTDDVNTTATAETPAKPKRESVAKKVHISPAGESRSASADETRLDFRFANGETVSVALLDFPEPIRTCAAWHGLAQKIGDGYASVKGDVKVALENARTIIECLKGGEWVDTSEGVGAAPSMVVEAIVRALKGAGETVNEARIAAIREKTKNKATRDGALKDPVIAAAYAAIRAENAVAKAKEAGKAAKGQALSIKF